MKRKTRSKLRICFVSNASDMYGAPKALLLILSKIDLNKFEPFVVCPDSGPLVKEIQLLNIPVYIISRKQEKLDLVSRVRYISVFIYFLVKKSPDLLYINTVAHAESILAGKKLGIPTLLHAREPDTWFLGRGIAKKIRHGIIMRLPGLFVCVSKATGKIFLDRGVTPGKVKIVYDGIDAQKFEYSDILRQRKRKELGISEGTIVVGFAGQIIPRKGIGVLIEAARIVCAVSTNYKFLVLGGSLDSPFAQKNVLTKIAEYNLEKNFIFSGFCQDMPSYFSAFDIFACTSVKEPFAMVNLEAMAMKRPIIATDTGGSPESIIDGVTGYIIPVNDSEALAKKIIFLGEDRSLRDRFGNAARKRLENNFTVDLYYKATESIINNFLLGISNGNS